MGWLEQLARSEVWGGLVRMLGLILSGVEATLRTEEGRDLIQGAERLRLLDCTAERKLLGQSESAEEP